MNTTHPTIEEWLGDLARQGKSVLTIATYRHGLAHFVRWSEQTYGQPFDPAAIIPRDIAEWKARQQTVENAPPATVNARLVALSRYFKWAAARGHARSDPTAEITSLRPETRHPKALGDVYVRRLLRHVHQSGNKRDIALVELLMGSGLRVSEALALRLADLKLNGRSPSTRPSDGQSGRSGEIVVRRGKGGMRRRVPLTGPVRQALKAYLETQPDLKSDDLLWVGERGPLRDRTGVFNLLKKYARQAGLDPDLISPHVLRHTFATRYLAANLDDLRGLAAILGHANLNTVMIYTEPTIADLAARMEKAEL
jgi:site-specific recombinase XerD